ncbi:MAG TPA: hypothetical protein VF039_01205 [Longimicrobiales bacterium]
MSEQPPRASGHVPPPGETKPADRLEIDPEAPRSASGAGREPVSRAEPVAPPRDAYGFPHLHDADGEYLDSEERVRARTSEGLDRAADAVRRVGHRARDQGGVVGRAEPIAYRVGDSLQSAASYVRAHDVYDMRDDVEERVHRSPLKALAIAAVGGFLLGRLFR